MVFAGPRTHFNDFPDLAHVYVIPLAFLTTPTFGHLLLAEATSADEIASVEIGSRLRARITMDFLRRFIPQNLMRKMEATPGIEPGYGALQAHA